MHNGDLATLLGFFKVMADENRLRMIGMLANRERSVEEIAAELELQPPTVSHHLAKLKSLDLVTMRRDGTVHYYGLNKESLHALSKQFLETGGPVPIAADEGDAYARKVMRAFVPDGAIRELPTSPKKRLIVLKWLVEKFDRDRKYPEKELSAIIKQFHSDYAAVRRYMIDEHLMERANGVYWRT